jgi:hypothetical protein
MRIHRIAVVLLSLLFTNSLSAAVVLQIETRDHNVSPPRSYTTDIVAEGRFLKTTMPAVGDHAGGEMLFRGDQRELVIVDHRSKTYMVMDQAAIRRLTTELNRTRSQVDEALKNVPDSQRASMEQLLRQRVPNLQVPAQSPAQVRLVGDRARVFGYPAVRYEVVRDGHRIRELWATDWGNIDGGRDVAQVFSELGAFTHDMTEALSNSLGGRSQALDDGVLAALQGVDGFPVGVREYGDDGTIQHESALRSISQRRLNAEELEPPLGYTERAMFPAQQNREAQSDWDRYSTPRPVRIGRTQ